MQVDKLKVHYASTPVDENWSDLDIHGYSYNALSASAAYYEEIYEDAVKAGKPEKMDRISAIFVAIKPHYFEEKSFSIMSIAEIGVEGNDLLEIFTLKATARAFNQAQKKRVHDLAPMQRLSDIPDDELHQAASATDQGLHVGVAGGWPHHSRLIAASFATELAIQMDLTPIERSAITPPELLDDAAAQARLEWLNEGQQAGDTELLDSYRKSYGFALKLLDR